MIAASIPGWGEINIGFVVLDYNGTLAVDGHPIPGVQAAIATLARDVEVHVVTADTFGKANSALVDYPVKLSVLSPGDHAEAKRKYVQKLGSQNVAAIGNGRNDRSMLKEAAIGIAVLEKEGLAVAALTAADLIAPGILSALDLLCNPLRLVAVLRA
jgi:P-type E1-E2 ATPase